MAAPAIHVKVGGVWRPVVNGLTNPFVKVGGSWRTVQVVYVKVGGVWKTAF